MNYRFLLTVVAAGGLAAAASPALAQDMDWSGFYIGVNAGGSWGDTNLHTSVGPGTGPVVLPPGDVALFTQTNSNHGNKSGFTGGVQGGYNWQMGSLLLGIETDFGALDVDEHRTNTYVSTVAVTPPITPAPAPVNYTLEQRAQTNWIWTLRPRIGYVSGPIMVYATGGIASTKVDLDTKYADTRNPPNSASIHESNNKTGWTLGVGGAYAFTPNWSVRGEWLYADFGHVNDSVTSTNGFATLSSESKVKANLVRLGVDYKF